MALPREACLWESNLHSYGGVRGQWSAIGCVEDSHGVRAGVWPAVFMYVEMEHRPLQPAGSVSLLVFCWSPQLHLVFVNPTLFQMNINSCGNPWCQLPSAAAAQPGRKPRPSCLPALFHRAMWFLLGYHHSSESQTLKRSANSYISALHPVELIWLQPTQNPLG